MAVPETGSAPRPLSLRQNFSWTFAGNVVHAAGQWGGLVVITKIGNAEMLGQLCLGLAITSPVIQLAGLQLKAIQATDSNEQFLFREYVTLRLTTTILAFGVIAIISFLGAQGGSAPLLILLVGIRGGLLAVNEVFYGLYQHLEEMDRTARAMIGSAVASLIALGGTLYLTGSIIWATAVWAVLPTLALTAWNIRWGRQLLRATRSRRDPRHTPPRAFGSMRAVFKLTRLGFPLGVVMMLISLNVTLPMYFIENRLGSREVGIFAALSYLMVAGQTVVGALGEAASPRLAGHYARAELGAFRSLVLKLVGLALGGAGLAMLLLLACGKELITLLYAPEYAAHTRVLLLLVIAAGLNFGSSFLGYGMTAARVIAVQIPWFAAVVLVQGVACWKLIPTFGLEGAGWASILAAVVQFFGGWAILERACRMGGCKNE